MGRLSLLFAIFPTLLSAQHCVYGFASIIAVRPHLEGDTQVVKGLRITLLDSMNLPVTIGGEAWHLFRPNSDYEACAHWQGGFMPGCQACFPFAKDNYVLVLPRGYDTSKLKVLVQDERPRSPVDIRRRKWPARYQQQVVPLTAFDSYRLCGVYDEPVYPPLEGRPNFAPVDIILHPQ